MKKPTIEQNGTDVIIHCYNEDSAKACKTHIEKGMNNRLFMLLMKQAMRKGVKH